MRNYKLWSFKYGFKNNVIRLDYSSKYYIEIFRNILLSRRKRERRLKLPTNNENWNV